MTFDHVDNRIIKMIINGNHVSDIAEDTKKATILMFPSKQSTNQSEIKISKMHVSSLWRKMTNLYGHLFIDIYGAEDTGVWFENLKDLTPKSLENGMERLIVLKSQEQFCKLPPNFLQFRALCMGFITTYIRPQLLRDLGKF